MLQKAEMPPEQWRRSESVGPENTGDDLLPVLIDRLNHLGFNVPALCGKQNNVAGGVPMRISVSQLLRPGAGPAGHLNDILNMLEAGIPLTLSLTDLGRGDTAICNLQRFCEYLQAGIATRGIGGDGLGLCMYSHQVPLQAFQVLANSIRGDGPRFVLLDRLQMTQHQNGQVQADSDTIWSFLWRNRQARTPLMPAYGATVRTGCPLLSDEVASSVLPVSGLQVPTDSAWLPISLSLPQFASDAGEIMWDRLLPAVAGGVELADAIFDRLLWPWPCLCTDAHLNRRLALSITDLGDLAVRCGRNPRDLSSLKWLSTIVARIRRTMWHRSGRLARSNGCLPALGECDAPSGWQDHVRRDDWYRRWQAALSKSAVRHRNILVLSPYCVVPSGTAGTVEYTDLLPVIAYADGWSFAGAQCLKNWSLQDYIAFHRRAWAVIQQRKTDQVVAAGV